jgi:hypothetical protein
MKCLDVETPSIKMPKRIVLNTKKVASMIYDSDNFDFDIIIDHDE